MKVLHLKSECAPERITGIQRMLLLAEPNMNKLKLKQNTHELDISALSQKERKFLFVALCDTMECYIQTDDQFHPGRIATAVRRAMTLCVKDRVARARMLLHIMDRSRGETGWLVRPKRWLFELMHAMNISKMKAPMPQGTTIADIRRRRQIAAAKKLAPENNATVEELQNALMLCWPEILERRPRFFILDKPVNEAAKESFVKSQMVSAHIDHGHVAAHRNQDVDDEAISADEITLTETLDKRMHRTMLDDEKMAEALKMATQPLEVGTEALRARHLVLNQEAWLLRAEVKALQEHLSRLESPEMVAPAPAPTNIGQATPQTTQHHCRELT
jgi:hypothetical protein